MSTDVAMQLRYGADPANRPRPVEVRVTEYRLPLTVVADRTEWWCVLTGEDGTEVLVPGDLIAPEHTPGEPETCEHPSGCGHYVDLSRDDYRCVDHAPGKAWP